MPDAPRPARLIGGLFETHLNVADLARSMRFYGDVLGLELGTHEPARGLAIYWIGPRGKGFLGLWEKPVAEVASQHFAFEVARADLDGAIAALKRQGVGVRNFFNQPTDVPTVFGWMPAASVYFDDPDGHLLEFLAMLPGEPRPEAGILPLDEWNRLTRSAPAG